MGNREGGGAGTAAAAAAAAAEPSPLASSRAVRESCGAPSGRPPSPAACLLGALHLVMSLIVAAARAEKEAFIQSDSIIEVLRFDDGGLLQTETIGLSSYQQKRDMIFPLRTSLAASQKFCKELETLNERLNKLWCTYYCSRRNDDYEK